MATIRLFIALIAMEICFHNVNVSRDTWFIGYALIFGLWIVGGEVGKIGDMIYKFKRVIEEWVEEEED